MRIQVGLLTVQKCVSNAYSCALLQYLAEQPNHVEGPGPLGIYLRGHPSRRRRPDERGNRKLDSLLRESIRHHCQWTTLGNAMHIPDFFHACTSLPSSCGFSLQITGLG